MEIVALVAAIAAIAAYAIADVLDKFSSSSSWEAAPCSYWHINIQMGQLDAFIFVYSCY